jgi:hypothetical protein
MTSIEREDILQGAMAGCDESMAKIVELIS